MKKTIGTAAVFIMTATMILLGIRSFAAENVKEVYLGGIPFGIKLYSDELKVVGFSAVDSKNGDVSPAYDAGIRKNDGILAIDGEKVSSVEDIVNACKNSGGGEITIECRRDGKIKSFSFKPALSVSEGQYKTGMWIKDGAAGIGTVTYIIPETRAFAGLGHGICDAVTGKLEKLSGGVVTEVDITDVKKSDEGSPGELVGSFTDKKTGSLVSNTESGVYGILSDIPDEADELIEIDDSAKEGDAYIRCTLGGNITDNYSVTIKNVDNSADTNKNYVIEVTDEKLLERSGGIVQGMSGSPIVQDGKLIGAVTHVFVNDPTKGYGISISEMLKSMPDILT